MSKLVAFLERVGQDASLRYATEAVLVEEMAQDAAVSESLGDSKSHREFTLAQVLKAQASYCCALLPGKEDEEEEEEEPSKEDEIRSASPMRRAA
ncbi:MAG TPA: hypothetical protein VFB32_07870 [Rudaea sp.]|nr:hypothetical protein [Rudaea sp.]